MTAVTTGSIHGAAARSRCHVLQDGIRSEMKKPETAVNALAEEFPKVALIKHTRQRAWIQLISRMNHHGKWKIQLMPIVAYPNQQQIRVIPL